MAAGRWVGRGDKEGGDGAAVDAMRELVNTVSMRGMVVIGEGEKDHAPMLFNGEEVGDGNGPEFDFAVDPIDGTTLMSKGMPNAISVLAVADRGACSTRPPCSTWTRSPWARGRQRDRHHRADRREPAGRRQGQGVVGVRHDRVHPGPAAPRPADPGGPGDRSPHPADHRRRRRRRDLGVPAAVGDRHADRHRRYPGGHRRRRRNALHGRRHPGAARPQGRRGTPEGDRRRPRPRPGADHRGPGLRRERLLLRHRGHQRRPAPGRAVFPGGAPRSRS